MRVANDRGGKKTSFCIYSAYFTRFGTIHTFVDEIDLIKEQQQKKKSTGFRNIIILIITRVFKDN